MTALPTTHRLDADGGELYYEVRGSGPLVITAASWVTRRVSRPQSGRSCPRPTEAQTSRLSPGTTATFMLSGLMLVRIAVSRSSSPNSCVTISSNG